jgi:hypothetical protein
LHEIYRYYEILGEEQYELHTGWLSRRLWKGIISLSSKSTAILTAIMSNSASHFGGRNGFTGGRGGQILSLGGQLPPQIYSYKRHWLRLKKSIIEKLNNCSFVLCKN